MADMARLKQIIAPEAQALGLDLVRVKMMPSEAGDGGQALQIMAEDPETGQLVIDQCAALSRAVSDQIDAIEEAGETLVEGAYHLEVSSPGIDRPLTRRKDFALWAGHEARIVMVKTYAGTRVHKGVLEGIEDGRIALREAPSEPPSYLAFEQIHSAKLVLTDALIAATQPLDSSGADHIIEEEKV